MTRKRPNDKAGLPPDDSPERIELLSFIEAEVFSRAWKRCSLGDDDLFRLQLDIMANPKGNPVIKGSGGLRKMRFSPENVRRGKSGAFRVCYVYFEEFGIVLLVTAYPKSKSDELSRDELSAARKMINERKKQLGRGRIQ